MCIQNGGTFIFAGEFGLDKKGKLSDLFSVSSSKITIVQICNNYSHSAISGPVSNMANKYIRKCMQRIIYLSSTNMLFL